MFCVYFTVLKIFKKQTKYSKSNNKKIGQVFQTEPCWDVFRLPHLLPRCLWAYSNEMAWGLRSLEQPWTSLLLPCLPYRPLKRTKGCHVGGVATVCAGAERCPHRPSAAFSHIWGQLSSSAWCRATCNWWMDPHGNPTHQQCHRDSAQGQAEKCQTGLKWWPVFNVHINKCFNLENFDSMQ